MTGMITVRRANVVLDIEEELKEEYMKNGFSVIDTSTGAILEKSMPTDVHSLQIEVARLKRENEELKAKLAEKKPAKAPAKKPEK